jgi:hypothetical protein
VFLTLRRRIISNNLAFDISAHQLVLQPQSIP